MTDRDYADMVNPYARMESDADARGYRRGALHAWTAALLIGLAFFGAWNLFA